MELLIDFHLITDIGVARERNEDRCGAFTPEDPETRAERGRLFVVADGMGGHVGGDVAAELAMQALPASYFQGAWSGPRDTLRQAFLATNAVIENKALSEPGRQGMGAAAVAAAILTDRAVLAHQGDCRAYMIRDGRAIQLTVDHSWVQERITAGWLTTEEARVHAYRNVLTRALGVEADANPTVNEVEFHIDDVLLLCSDGLWGVVEDAEMAKLATEEPSARDAARALVDLALERQGADNISVIVVRATGIVDGNGSVDPAGA
jgi:serine/threonine protein phosphatase PrpC